MWRYGSHQLRINFYLFWSGFFNTFNFCMLNANIWGNRLVDIDLIYRIRWRIGCNPTTTNGWNTKIPVRWLFLLAYDLVMKNWYHQRSNIVYSSTKHHVQAFQFLFRLRVSTTKYIKCFVILWCILVQIYSSIINIFQAN